MPTSRNTDYMQDLGSKNATYREVNSSGSFLTTTTQFPIIKSSSISDTTAQNDREDEGGNVYTQDGARTTEYTQVYMQRDEATLELHPTTLRNKHVTILKQMTGGSYKLGTVNQYMLIGYAKNVPDLSVSFPGGEPEGKFKCEAFGATTTLDPSDLDDGNFDDTITSQTFTFDTSTRIKYFTE